LDRATPYRETRELAAHLVLGGDVTAAEIIDNGDAGQFGEQRGIADLQRVAVFRTMADSLTVAADGIDLCSRMFACDSNGGMLSAYSRANRLAVICA